MAYGINVRERAYALFLMGQNPEQIAESLRSEYETLSANTVRSWAEDADDKGETWADRRTAVDAAARRRIEESASTERARARSRSATLSKMFFDMMVNGAAGAPKSFEGMGFLFKTMQGMAVDLEDDEHSRFSPIMAAEAIMDALNEDPEVRKVLKARWPVVAKLIQARLSMVTRTQEIEVEPERLEPPEESA